MYCLSVSHKSVPLEVRADLSFRKEEQEELLRRLLAGHVVTECVILSTCNRSELYFDGGTANVQKVQKELAAAKGVSLEMVLKYFYCYQGERAIRHLYKVAAGMESMVLGEDEILGQLKEAFFFARSKGGTGYYFNTVFQGAITCAKKIKTNTRLSKIPVSIGTLAAQEIFQFEKEGPKNILMIGITGKMGSIIKKNISGREDIHITGTVRNHDGIQKAVGGGITQIDYEKRYEVMDEADIIISVTTSPHYTITYGELVRVLTTRKRRLFMDLSVPMDIDQEITKIDGVTLYDIDYFNLLSKENNDSKRKELGHAEELLLEYVAEMKKTLCFHEFLEELPRVKEIFRTKQFEQILYKLRDESSGEELEAILRAFARL